MKTIKPPLNIQTIFWFYPQRPHWIYFHQERERERVRATKDVMRKHIRRKVNRTEAAETS